MNDDTKTQDAPQVADETEPADDSQARGEAFQEALAEISKKYRCEVVARIDPVGETVGDGTRVMNSAYLKLFIHP